MSKKFNENSENGNSMEDWCAFEILCGRKYNDSCHKDACYTECNVDIVTTLRSELCALSYKNDKIENELNQLKGYFAVKENECENLRAQIARQTALIGSLHNRLTYAEKREQYIQTRSDKALETLKKELHESTEKERQMINKIEHLESLGENEKIEKHKLKTQLCNFLQSLGNVFGLNEIEISNITPECIITHAKEVLVHLDRAKEKNNYTCQTLKCCENELSKIKNIANLEKQRLNSELENSNDRLKELEVRSREYKRELQIMHERLVENELCTEKMKEELRGLESRCFRLQNNLDRIQTDHHQFLRTVAKELQIDEPYESVITSKICQVMSDNNILQEEIKTLRHEIHSQHEKLKEIEKSGLHTEEMLKCELEEHLQRHQFEVQKLRKENLSLLKYFKRLACLFNWNPCFTSNDNHDNADNFLDHLDKFVDYCESFGVNNINSHLKDCYNFQNGHTVSTLRRERSCNDMSLKESTNIYNLQRRIRILREQIQKRDLQLELLKKKLSIVNNGANGNCILQSEREEAINQAKRAAKQINQLSAQIADVKAQLAEAIEYKITSLERARKIDELSIRISKLISEKSNILEQGDILKGRLKSVEYLLEKQRNHYEDLINGLRHDLQRLKSKLIDTNGRISHLNDFRTSVAHLLHADDMPDTHLLQRLQILCSSHRDFQTLSKPLENSAVCCQCDDSDEPNECQHS